MYVTTDKACRVTLVANEPASRYKTYQLRISNARKNRTELVNVEQVAKDMHVEALDLITFISYGLGTNYQIVNDVYYLNGKWECEQINVVIKKFITGVLNCPICHLPELIIGTGTCKGNCNACGSISDLSLGKFSKYLESKKSKVAVSVAEDDILTFRPTINL